MHTNITLLPHSPSRAICIIFTLFAACTNNSTPEQMDSTQGVVDTGDAASAPEPPSSTPLADASRPVDPLPEPILDAAPPEPVPSRELDSGGTKPMDAGRVADAPDASTPTRGDGGAVVADADATSGVGHDGGNGTPSDAGTKEPFEELEVVALEDTDCGDFILSDASQYDDRAHVLFDSAQTTVEGWVSPGSEAAESFLSRWDIDFATHVLAWAHWGYVECGDYVAITHAREFADRVEVLVTFGDICGDDAVGVSYAAAAIPRRDKPYVFIQRDVGNDCVDAGL